MFTIYDEPESPHEGVFKIYDEPESPKEGACLRVYNETESPDEGACLRYMFSTSNSNNNNNDNDNDNQHDNNNNNNNSSTHVCDFVRNAKSRLPLLVSKFSQQPFCFTHEKTSPGTHQQTIDNPSQPAHLA